MNTKTKIIISSAIVITSSFVLYALTSSNAYSNNSKNVTQNTQTSTVPPKQLEGATIIENNKSNNSPSNSADSSKGTDEISKGSIESTSKNPQNEDGKANEKDAIKPTSSKDTTMVSKENYTIYEVKQDESLSSICKQFADTVPVKIISRAILDANSLKGSSEVKTGMKLKIPTKYSMGSSYKVASGDSLYTIASTYMKDTNIYEAIERIKKDNFLSSDNIKIGEELFLYGISKTKEEINTSNSSKNASFVKEQSSNEAYKLYTLKKGENLASICKQYEKYCPSLIASKTILKYNNISNSKDIKEGSTIKIPQRYLMNGKKYTIRTGDSLSKIAVEHLKNLEMYKAINKIMKDNFKTTQDIRVGEEIFITSLDL